MSTITDTSAVAPESASLPAPENSAPPVKKTLRETEIENFQNVGLTKEQATLAVDSRDKVMAIADDLKAAGMRLCLTVSTEYITGHASVVHRPFPCAGLTIVSQSAIDATNNSFIKAIQQLSK